MEPGVKLVQNTRHLMLHIFARDGLCCSEPKLPTSEAKGSTLTDVSQPNKSQMLSWHKVTL